MRYVSVFSGIEAASVAWEPLGWEPIAFCEIDEFPSAVLRKRYPNVPNLGDITKVDWSPYRGSVDLVIGGSPCQSFSIAGKREGLAGASGLMFEYVRCVREVMPRWLIWENVPGALSSERGWAFEQLLSSLDECGYGLAWRVLDAQFFGVAQRRRLVFLVGHLGDMRASEVLFESESVSGNTQTSKQKREALAADARGRSQGAGGGCLTPWDVQSKQIFTPDSCGPTLNAGGNNWNPKNVQPCILDSAHNGCLTPWDVQSKRVFTEHSVAPTLPSGGTEGMTIQPVVMASGSAGFCGYASHTAKSIGYEDELAPTLKGNDWQSQVPDVVQQAYVMASGQANAEITEGGGVTNADPSPRSADSVPHATTSNGSDVFPALCATDGSKQFIDNQSVDGGRLILDRGWP